MKKVGFIGLGHLGKAMAHRLVSEGIDLVVWNRTSEKMSDVPAGKAQNPRDLARQVDIMFLCLFDSAAVHEVLMGDNGIFDTDISGKLIIDTTTNHFSDVVSFHAACSRVGCGYLEAPVLGSVVPASQGNLVILVSGNEHHFQTAREYLEKIGKNLYFL
ncbi:MAG: NAD(P)-dependent oxidoreductase, partial [Syntrophorhabdus sp.]